MNKIVVNASREYDILIEHGLIYNCGKKAAERFDPCSVCVITDDVVNRLYSDYVIESLNNAGFKASRIIFPSGEHSKSLSTYSNIMESMAESGFDRSDMVLALGGGVVGDVAGFVAATYMRGVKYIQMPTTYLSAIDSSVGAMVSVNLFHGKNLAGSFWQPSLVMSDPDVLKSLPHNEKICGMAEAIKTGAVSDKSIIEHVLTDDYPYVVERCLSIKKSMIEADEMATGLQLLLEFGHTIGMAIEKLSDFSMPHGIAVAKGMVAESKAAFRTGLTDADIAAELTKILAGIGIDTLIPYTSDEIYNVALNDSKIEDGRITVVIPEKIGKCRLCRLQIEDLKDFITAAIDA